MSFPRGSDHSKFVMEYWTINGFVLCLYVCVIDSLAFLSDELLSRKSCAFCYISSYYLKIAHCKWSHSIIEYFSLFYQYGLFGGGCFVAVVLAKAFFGLFHVRNLLTDVFVHHNVECGFQALSSLVSSVLCLN